MTRTIRPRSWAAAAAAAALMVGITGSPAAARPLGPDDTPSARASGAAADGAHCPLRRVEHQLVRCDNLTGAGVAAPVWIEES